jgi:hypothetical protein
MTPLPPRKKTGKKPTMTPMQEIDVWAWYQAKIALGTVKTKARELGLNYNLIVHFLAGARARQARADKSVRRHVNAMCRRVPF